MKITSRRHTVSFACLQPALGPAAVLAVVLTAFVFAGGQTRAAETIGPVPLPDPVLWLAKPEDFFFGNGVAGGGGAGDGTWNFLVGPDYTCPNYLNREEIRLVVDGTEQTIPMKVHRARETGVFYGTARAGDLKIRLLDYGPHNESWLGRLLTIENTSASTAHQFSARAYLVPLTGPGRTDWLATNDTGAAAGVGLMLDTSLRCDIGHFCRNWTNRYALICFDVPATALHTTNGYQIETSPATIKPGASSDITLYHYLHHQDQTDRDCFQAIRQRDSLVDAGATITWWQHWFNDVSPAYSLDRIPIGRGRDLVEDSLTVLEMNVSHDGGMVANERGWNMSYIRDAYCGLRGLEAFGHFDEVKNFMQWLDRQYAVDGFIPNAGPAGSTTYAHPNGNNGRYCPEENQAVEVTAEYLLDARDYYRATHDLATLTNLDASLRYSMDIQLKHAIQNGYRLEFSGDETELCGAADVAGIRAEGFNRKLPQYWSMTSVALCAASLEFYIEYLKLQDLDPTAYYDRQNQQTLSLPRELKKLQDALERDFWRTDVTGCPQGFHDWFRIKSNGAWPTGRIVNFTLFPLFYGTPLEYPGRGKDDVIAMKQYFNPQMKFLPLIGLRGHEALGHDLGYLLWGLVAINDPEKKAVYDALINGPTVCRWGGYHEAYAGDGTPNHNSLRSFETGVNLSAIGAYWGLGNGVSAIEGHR